MNMSSLMDRLTTYLLIFYFFTFVCIYGGGQDLSPPCRIDAMVRRGTTWRAAPGEHVTVRCPVKHCGESVNVAWCKLLDTDKCELINLRENVEITQADTHTEDEMISFLIFKRISIDDDGLYRCDLKGYESESISHTINISVSDLYQGVKEIENRDVAADEDLSWLPYFYIWAGIALLVAILITLTLLSFYGQKRIYSHTQGATQEMPTHVIPDLPKGSAPSCSLQTSISFVNDIYSPSNAQRPPSQPPLRANLHQPAVANTADDSQVFDRSVYSVINRQQSGVRQQHKK